MNPSSPVLPLFRPFGGDEISVQQLSALIRPLRFLYRLNNSDEPLTYVTMTCCHDKDVLSFYLACFEKNPDPQYRFLFSFGENTQKMISLSFSCSSADLPLGDITLRRDGGENLEGVFWGAYLSLPLAALPEFPFPFTVEYYRGDVISSPFPTGKAILAGKP